MILKTVFKKLQNVLLSAQQETKQRSLKISVNNTVHRVKKYLKFCQSSMLSHQKDYLDFPEIRV